MEERLTVVRTPNGCKDHFNHDIGEEVPENLQRGKSKQAKVKRDLEKVIHAFISTRLDDCNSLYVGISQASFGRLQLVQSSAARLLVQTAGRKHVTPILASLNWLTVHYRTHFKLLLFVFKRQNNPFPSYLSDLLHP